MNTRIKQLITQAGTDVSGKWMSVDHAEKFAELIIKECARVARATPCPVAAAELTPQTAHAWDMAFAESGKEIVQHFKTAT